MDSSFVPTKKSTEYNHYKYTLFFCIKINTVEPRFTDTHLIRTPAYYGQFCFSRRKAHIVYLALTRLIQTPVNTDNGHFSVTRVSQALIQS